MMHRCFALRTFSTKAPLHYDLCIVGGGIVGSSLACAFANAPEAKNQRIALIEASDLLQKRTKSGFSNRVSSITPSSKAFLQGNHPRR
jgi:2-polyprenyl-6-methoxyphenol hydroxylase-like FAD-dependent oxidoreductase